MTDTEAQKTIFQSVQDTAKTIAADKPDLKDLVDTFAGLLEASQTVEESLGDWDIATEGVDRDRLINGEYLLQMIPLADFSEHVDSAAEIMFPALQKAFPALAEELGKIRTAGLPEGSLDLYACMQALIAGDEKPLREAVQDKEFSYEVLVFLLAQFISPFLRSQSRSIARDIDLSAWTKGSCPVCGSAPSVAYLVGEGGKRWLHCSQCGHEWRIPRQACPHCANSEPKGLEYFYIEDRISERAYLCKECKKYLLVIDIRELVLKPNMDIAPLGLIALDIKAQEQGYAPLANLPWNTLD